MTEAAAVAAAPAGGWHVATVREVAHPNPEAVVLRLEVPGRIDHLPGQHYVLRLTAADGYSATRSYSIASPASDPLVELYVERLPDGEVSTYLADALRPGDLIDVRGPIGGWFVWRGQAPALLVGGGTGVVPLVAMLRHARDDGRADLLRLAVGGRTLAALPYADELATAGATIALSREDGTGGRPRGRLNRADLADLLGPPTPGWTAYVCGSARFAEGASELLLRLGVMPGDVRVERFGPS